MTKHSKRTRPTDSASNSTSDQALSETRRWRRLAIKFMVDAAIQNLDCDREFALKTLRRIDKVVGEYEREAEIFDGKLATRRIM